MATVTLKLVFPGAMIEALDAVATVKQWTRSQTIRNFMLDGMMASGAITAEQSSAMRRALVKGRSV